MKVVAERPAQDDFRARLSGDPRSLLSLVVVTIIVVKVVPEFGDFYNQFGKELPLSTRFIVGVSTFVTTYLLCSSSARSARDRGCVWLGQAARPAARGSIV